MRDLSHREMKSVAISSRTMDVSETGRATASLRDETVDAVVSIAVLQLIPDPPAALAANVPARMSCTRRVALVQPHHRGVAKRFIGRRQWLRT